MKKKKLFIILAVVIAIILIAIFTIMYFIERSKYDYKIQKVTRIDYNVINEKISIQELSEKIEKVDVFARMNPLQKERVVELYRKNNHVVGYMGDGVNDAPSLTKADVGISVSSATSIAKEASDIIILKQSLKVIYDGVLEGRKVYRNIIKYNSRKKFKII